MNNFARGTAGLNLSGSVDDPHPHSYQLPSKDKRNQIPPTDVKQFVRDDNVRRTLVN